MGLAGRRGWGYQMRAGMEVEEESLELLLAEESSCKSVMMAASR